MNTHVCQATSAEYPEVAGSTVCLSTSGLKIDMNDRLDFWIEEHTRSTSQNLQISIGHFWIWWVGSIWEKENTYDRLMKPIMKDTWGYVYKKIA